VLKLARVMENFMKIKSKNNNLVLGSSAARCEGSSPFRPTI